MSLYPVQRKPSPGKPGISQASVWQTLPPLGDGKPPNESAICAPIHTPWIASVGSTKKHAAGIGRSRLRNELSSSQLLTDEETVSDEVSASGEASAKVTAWALT